MRTLFFDIDGTLLITHGAGSIALERAMQSEFGINDFSTETIQFGGRTDFDLVRQILTVAEIPKTTENLGRLRTTYSGLLRQTLKSVGGTLLPGVEPLLKELMTVSRLDLAVMTGNYPETARMKLEAFELAEYFSWVIGGDLDADRSDMARRAARQLQRRSEATHDMIVIGDTPNDVRCAHAINARCLAVCTGSATRQELQEANADLIVESLTDDGVLEYLSN